MPQIGDIYELVKGPKELVGLQVVIGYITPEDDWYGEPRHFNKLDWNGKWAYYLLAKDLKKKYKFIRNDAIEAWRQLPNDAKAQWMHKSGYDINQWCEAFVRKTI